MITISAVRAALLATLQTIDGTGDYTLDLSTTSHHGAPPRQGLPSVGSGVAYLWRADATHSRGGEAPVGAREVVVSWNIVVYGAADTAAAADREDWIDAAEADLLAALDAALNPGGDLAAVVEDLGDITVSPLSSSQANAPDPCAIWVQLTTVHIYGVA